MNDEELDALLRKVLLNIQERRLEHPDEPPLTVLKEEVGKIPPPLDNTVLSLILEAAKPLQQQADRASGATWNAKISGPYVIATATVVSAIIGGLFSIFSPSQNPSPSNKNEVNYDQSPSISTESGDVTVNILNAPSEGTTSLDSEGRQGEEQYP